MADGGTVTNMLGDIVVELEVTLIESDWMLEPEDNALEVCPDSGRNLGVMCLVFK